MAARTTMGSRALAAEVPETDPDRAVMERNGITRTTSHHYWVEGYRYSNLADALAQVRRSVRAREAIRGQRPA
ncbi:hypothetical protein RCO27_10925 [Sphingosinicella sp. LHD-64]|uniref:hypothetical protein n=1 Tax=Sphingosinicella sp. LHD-64 TaxID=3072139 RepID=UPI00280D88EC|nr:hypothetical protein [Sphingosinicella sp. LHD-64]MDQ8756741.1 hypothetical protein [Sphingosinicella sp. LHD-64]